MCSPYFNYIQVGDISAGHSGQNLLPVLTAGGVSAGAGGATTLYYLPVQLPTSATGDSGPNQPLLVTPLQQNSGSQVRLLTQVFLVRVVKHSFAFKSKLMTPHKGGHYSIKSFQQFPCPESMKGLFDLTQCTSRALNLAQYVSFGTKVKQGCRKVCCFKRLDMPPLKQLLKRTFYYDH